MANNSYPQAGDRTPSACAQREEYWRRILARHRQSGLSATDFCKREQVKPSAMSWWARELRQREGARRKPAAKKAPTRKPNAATFVPVRVIEAVAAGGSAAVEIVTRRGQVVRVPTGFDAATLRRVIVVLEEQPC